MVQPRYKNTNRYRARRSACGIGGFERRPWHMAACRLTSAKWPVVSPYVTLMILAFYTDAFVANKNVPHVFWRSCLLQSYKTAVLKLPLRQQPRRASTCTILPLCLIELASESSVPSIPVSLTIHLVEKQMWEEAPGDRLWIRIQ